MVPETAVLLILTMSGLEKPFNERKLSKTWPLYIKIRGEHVNISSLKKDYDGFDHF